MKKDVVVGIKETNGKINGLFISSDNFKQPTTEQKRKIIVELFDELGIEIPNLPQKR